MDFPWLFYDEQDETWAFAAGCLRFGIYRSCPSFCSQDVRIHIILPVNMSGASSHRYDLSKSVRQWTTQNLHVLLAVYDARFNYRFTDDCMSLLWGVLRTTLLFATLQGSQARTVDVCAVLRIIYCIIMTQKSDAYLYCTICIYIFVEYQNFFFISIVLTLHSFVAFGTNRPSSVIEASEFCLFMWAWLSVL